MYYNKNNEYKNNNENQDEALFRMYYTRLSSEEKGSITKAVCLMEEYQNNEFILDQIYEGLMANIEINPNSVYQHEKLQQILVFMYYTTRHGNKRIHEKYEKLVWEKYHELMKQMEGFNELTTDGKMPNLNQGHNFKSIEFLYREKDNMLSLIATQMIEQMLLEEGKTLESFIHDSINFNSRHDALNAIRNKAIDYDEDLEQYIYKSIM